MAGFWAGLPAGRVVRLAGATPAAISSAFEPMQADAPAVVVCRPIAARSPARVVTAILDRLEAAALDLYPTWLPGAEAVESPGGAAIAAVRALAYRHAAGTPHFGPFLADLAARSLNGRSSRTVRVGDQLRAAGLARVVADSYRRAHLALLIERSESMDPDTEETLVAACEWLAHYGRVSVWLAGDGWHTGDRLPVAMVQLPDHEPAQAARDGMRSGPKPVTTLVRLPTLAGAPHPASRSERALESALARASWAAGRVWNRTFRPDPLTNPIRVDLMWPAEQCAVEIDGAEHRGLRHYEDDRRRDVMLQLAGFAVLRYTNTQIEHDISAVLSQLEQFITTRRLGKDGNAG